MQFDHIRGEKSFNIGETTASRVRLEAEIAKCDIVCANCRAERTHQRKKIRQTKPCPNDQTPTTTPDAAQTPTT